MAGGFLRAAGGFAADRLAAAGADRAKASARDAVLALLVLGDSADKQVSAGVLLALATPIVPINMAVTGLGAEASAAWWSGRRPSSRIARRPSCALRFSLPARWHVPGHVRSALPRAT